MDELIFFIEQLKSDDFEAKINAINMLGEFKDKRAVKPLLTLLGDKDWQVRNAVVDALANIKDNESIEIITEYLRDEDPNIRNAAMQVLEKLGEDVVFHLIKNLKDPDDDVRIFAANTLGNLGRTEAVPVLISVLDDPNENVFYAAAEALGRIKDRKAVLPLIDKLEEKDIWDRFVIITALGEIGDERAIDALINQLKYEEIKIVVIEALGKIISPEVFPPLIEAINTENDKDVKVEALKGIFNVSLELYSFTRIERNSLMQDFLIENLQKINFSEIQDVLEEIFNSEDIELISQILQILNWADAQISLKNIVKLLNYEELEEQTSDLLIKQKNISLNEFRQIFESTESEHIKSLMIKSLGYQFNEEITEFLYNLLQNDSPEILTAAAEALLLQFADLETNETIVNKLLSLLSSKDESIKQAAESVLIVFAHHEHILTKIKKLMDNGDNDIISSCIRIISISNQINLLDNILKFIDSPYELNRKEVYRAINYLCRIEENKKIITKHTDFDKILLGINDTSDEVRIEAILALGALQHNDAFEVLKNAFLDETFDYVKPYIVRALKEYSYNDEVVKLFIEYFPTVTNIETKLAIISSFSLFKKYITADYLSDLLFQQEENDIKSEIILVMGEIGTEDAQDYLIPFLEEDDWFLVNSTILALSNIISNDIKVELLNLLDRIDSIDAKEIILNNLLRALKNYPEENVAKKIFPFLKNKIYMYNSYEALLYMLKNNLSLAKCYIDYFYETDDINIKKIIISIFRELEIGEIKKVFLDRYQKTQYNSIKLAILIYLNKINFDITSIIKDEKNIFIKNFIKKMIEDNK